MPGFLYFVENHAAPRVGREHLAAWGMEYLLDSDKQSPASTQAVKGPGDKGGVTFAMTDQQAGQNIGYFPDDQEWRPMTMAGDDPAAKNPVTLHVGWWKHAPPTPDDLVRRKTLPGDKVTAGDKKWIVPKIRQWVVGDESAGYATSLPSTLRRTRDGWKDDGVEERYRGLLEANHAAAQSLWDAAFSADEEGVAQLELDNILDHAVALLGVNYTLGADEAAFLGFNGIDALVAVVQSSCDWVEARDYLLKKSVPAPVPEEKPGAAA